MRFHLYFTVRRLLRRMKGGESMSNISSEFGAGEFYRNIEHIHRNMFYRSKGGVIYYLYTDSIQSDYKRYVAIISNGSTQIGFQYLNQSIESYLYCILDSQVKTKQSEVSSRESGFETQEQFRKLFEDSVINYDVSTWIINVNRSISDCNARLNLALNPSLWLMSNNLIILKNPIKVYNNLLKTYLV